MRLLTIIFILFTFGLSSQIAIKGKIIDLKSAEPISFVAVGSSKTNQTTLSDEFGVFDLPLKNYNKNDSIKFYAIGYTELIIPLSSLTPGIIHEIKLESSGLQLEEVEVKAKKLYEQKLGITKYDKRNCSGFIDFENNWKGVETAIRLDNKEGRYVRVKDFSFYIIKNTLKDSLTFRLNFYSANKYYPTKNILKRSIIFKTNQKQGEVKLDLNDYNISAYDDFYVSLECLMEKVSISDFCFAGEITEPSYVREGAFRKWKKVRGGGAAFNVTVLYSKKD